MMNFCTQPLDEVALTLLAQGFAGCVQQAACLCLEGDLGAGKSTFARAWVCAASGETDVPSPTFSLVQEYAYSHSGLALFHADLYRLDSLAEVQALGFGDMLHQGVCLIEWASKVPAAFDGIGVPLAQLQLDERSVGMRVLRLSSAAEYWQAIAVQLGLEAQDG